MSEHRYLPSQTFTKRATGAARGRRRREAVHLALVAGPGVVPLEGLSDDGEEVRLHLARAEGSLADVLAERGPLTTDETRAVGVATARALARLHLAALVHGDVKPANLLLGPGGELWLGDLDAAQPADGRPLARTTPHRVPRGAVAAPDTDMVALALTLVECSTGMVPDPDATWDTDPLVAIGVPRGLAIDLAAVLAEHRRPGASELAARLVRPEIELPSPARRARGVDSSPTVDFDPVGHPLGGA